MPFRPALGSAKYPFRHWRITMAAEIDHVDLGDGAGAAFSGICRSLVLRFIIKLE
jgi:hypothetical protein